MTANSTLQITVTAKDQASRVLNDVSKEATGLGKAFGEVSKIAGGFIAANVVAGAGQKVLGFLGDSIKAASDLGESVNAVNVIFGDSAGTILEWGKTSSTQAGLSQRAFQQLATPLGAMLKNAGFDMDTVATKTIDLTKRAADMASVFNTDVEDALGAIQAGLRGELDPLERFGVKLSAAAVESRALADTGKDLASSLTEQEKAAARVALIFEQTDAVAGDFANTSDELANKTRIQQARMEELQATIGQKLLPVQMAITEAKLAMVNLLVTKVIPVLEELYAKHWPAIQKAIQDVTPIIQFMAEYFIARIQGVIQSIEALVGIITSMVNLVNAIIHGDWSRAWQEAQNIAENAINLIIGTIRAQFGNLPDILYRAGRDAGNSLIQGIRDAASARVEIGGININPLARASGGPVTAGMPYMVGERGPELFIPGRSGTIMPNGTGINVSMQNVTINAQDRQQAELSGGLAGWGIMAAMRSRGVA